jgi:hypothetical protein
MFGGEDTDITPLRPNADLVKHWRMMKSLHIARTVTRLAFLGQPIGRLLGSLVAVHTSGLKTERGLARCPAHFGKVKLDNRSNGIHQV